MIASLRGTLLERSEGACVVEVGGVGYHVFVSMHTAQELPAPGSEVRLRTRQVVREDAHMLFGFAESEELHLFDLLIGVSGVGPKLAMAVLSGIRPRALARAIREERVAALVAVPGIGRKTAERLVVELRDKLESVAAAEPPAPREAGILPRSQRDDDAVTALLRLGFGALAAREVVRGVVEEEPGLTLEELVRRALTRLGQSASQPTAARAVAGRS